MAGSQWTLEYGNDQHIGKRNDQQDYFALSDEPTKEVVESAEGFLVLVADGMGGHAGGGKASVIAVTTFLDAYQQKSIQETIPDALIRALLQANAAVFDKNRQGGQGEGMGTTLVACVLQSRNLYWISVGDSPLFLYRDARLVQINQEHSYGMELDLKIQGGQISQAEAEAERNKRNRLTSCLGMETIPPKIDCPKIPYELKTGEKVLLCSDGLVNALSLSEIALRLETEHSAQEKCELLTQDALGKNRTNQDNITVALLEINPMISSLRLDKELTLQPHDTTRRIVSKAQSKQNLTSLIGIVSGVLVVMMLLLFVSPLKKHLFPNPEPTPTIAIVATATPRPTVTPRPTPSPSPTPTPTNSPTPIVTPTPIFSPETGAGVGIDGENDAPCDLKIMQALLSLLNLYDGKPDNDCRGKTREGLNKLLEQHHIVIQPSMQDVNPCNSIQEVCKQKAVQDLLKKNQPAITEKIQQHTPNL